MGPSAPAPTTFSDFSRQTWERFDRLELQNKNILQGQAKIQESILALADTQRAHGTTLDQVRRNYFSLAQDVRAINERTQNIYTDAHSVVVGWIARYGSGETHGGPSETQPSDVNIDPSE